ncbi:ATP synthase subunit O [Forsythia ovata]|uniref:ATP synthase subunit O n=1 Tax=Forsythia ovata TaxID=205694 RepID=A0ABD1TPX6_9LAMI
MAMAGRLRRCLPLLRRVLTSDTLSASHRPASIKVLTPTLTNQEFSRNYAAASAPKEQKVKVPLTIFGVSGNYASALYIAAVKANVLDKLLWLNLGGEYTLNFSLSILHICSLYLQKKRELKGTLLDIIGHGKKVKVEQKIDTSILGGLVVEFGQKVFDMSIKTRARQMERFLRLPVNLEAK